MLLSSFAWANTSTVYDIGQVTAASGVNVRASTSFNAKVLGLLRAQDTFAVSKKNDWYVILDGPFAGGFVRQEFVNLTGERFPLSKVVADSVRIRAAPSKSGAVRGDFSSGAVFASQKQGEWIEIKDGAYKGQFVTAQLVADVDTMAEPSVTPTPTPVSTPAPTPVAAVTPVSAFAKGVVIAKAPVNARAAPAVKSAKTGSFSPGIFVDVEPAGPEWYKIQSGLNQGSYIAAQFVKIVPPTQVVVAAAAPPGAATPVAAPSSWDPKTEKIFQDQVEKAFKKKAKPAPENEVVMPVYFEDRSMLLGQIDSRVREGEALTVESPPFFKFLRLLVTQAWFDRPEIAEINPEVAKGPQDLAAKRWVSIKKFENTGIKVSFNEQRLEIIVSVPPELRAPTIASILKGSQTTDEIALAEPASRFSTFLNINASETFDTRYEEFADRRMPLRAQLESGTNIFGLVLEANGRYLEDRSGNASDSTGLARGDVRAVKDFPNHTIRTSVGDLVYPTSGFQTFRQMAGVSLTSNFTMARSKLTYPTGNYEIFLQRNSKVYVWMNDQLQQVLDLPAGRHSLKDFPFANGVNELRLEIVDDVGREETQNFTYFSSTELLRPALHQYNYAVGAPAADVGNERTYDSTNTTVSAFHRYGLFEDLTVGANVQSDKLQTVTGLEALWSTKIGFLKLEPAVSILNSETGGAFRVNYIYSDYKGPMKTQRSYRLGVYHAGTSFAPLGATNLTGSKRTLELTTGYTQGLRKNLSMNFNGSYRFFNTPTGPEDAFTLGMGANRKWDNGLSTSATLSHTKTQTGAEDLNLFVFLLWSFPKEKQIVTAIHNSTDESTRLDWSYNPSAGADSSSYGASLRDSQTERGYNLQTLHDGNRLRASLSHEVILGKQPTPGATGEDANKKPTNHTTSINIGTALAFAGGHFAIGRPVTDSFAIIAPVKNLRGARLDVNPLGDNGYTAKSDILGPALIPELGSYNFAELTISGKKLPPELNLPKDHFSVYPGYRSGYAFEVGTDATVYLTAKVIGPDGEPLSLAAGRGFYLDEAGHEPVTVFTNKKGVLNSEGFKPGRYRLEISTDAFEPVEITIPESSTDVFDLGTLKLKAK